MVKLTNSQQVESQTTNMILQHVESDAISPPLDRSVSFEVIPSNTQGGDQVAEHDTDDDDDEDQGQAIDDVQESIQDGRTWRNSRKPSWLTTNMIVAHALSVIEEKISFIYRKLKLVRSPRCERMS